MQNENLSEVKSDLFKVFYHLDLTLYTVLIIATGGGASPIV